MEQIGLEAVLLDKNFQEGVRRYLEGIGVMTKQTDASTKQMAASQKTTTKAQQGTITSTHGLINAMQQGASVSTMLSGVVAGLGVSFGLKLAEGIMKAVGAMAQFLLGAPMVASRFKELGLVAEYMTVRMGGTSEEFKQLHSDLTEMGIRGDVASQTITQLARRQLDLAQATQLASVAQGAAVVAGEDSSETLEHILQGIETLNVRVLRNAGIMVSAQSAYEAYGVELGKSASQLTEAEKRQAFMNAAIADGANLMELYDLAQNTARKQASSFKRELIDLQAALGVAFEPALISILKPLREVVGYIKDAVSEGGAWHETMIVLGTVFSWISEKIGVAIKAIGQLIVIIGNYFGRAVNWASNYGFDLIQQYATGIIRGISSVLVAAMNYLTNMLSSWLAPHSPPKVAPDIIKWGADTFTQYLEGFQDADFSVLDNLQKNMNSALGNLVAMGKIDQGGMQKTFIGLSDAFAEAMSNMRATGVIDTGIFTQLSKGLGPFGDEIAKVAKLETQMALATDKAAKAEEELANAQARRLLQNSKLNSMIERHNILLRSGATKEQIAQSLKAIDAQEDQLRLTDDQVKSAEDRADEAKKGAKEEEKALKKQQQILDNLLEMQKASIVQNQEMAAAAAGGAGGGLGAGLGDLGAEMGEGLMDGLTNVIDEKKAELKAKWDEMWANIKAEWDQMWIDLGMAWAPLWENVVAFWERLKAAFTQSWEILKFIWNTGVQTLKDAWTEFTTNIALVWENVKTTVSTKAQEIWTSLTTWWANIRTNVTSTIEGLKADAISKFNEIRTNIQNVVNAIGQKFDYLKDKVNELKNKFIEWKERALDVIGLKLAEIKDFIRNQLEGAFGRLKDKVYDLMSPFRTLAGIIGGILQKLRELGAALANTNVPADLEEHSPSAFENTFRNLAASVFEAKKQMADFEMMNRRISVPSGAQSSVVNNYYSNTFSPNLNANYAQSQSMATLREDLIYFNSISGG